MFKKSNIRLLWLTVILFVLSGCTVLASPPGTPADVVTEVRFIAENGAFQGPASAHAGWVQMHLENRGPAYDHIQLLKLEEGRTVADLQAALAESPVWPAWAIAAGGPNAPDPGAQSSAYVYLTEGEYALVSWTPDQDGSPRYLHGMIASLTVHGVDQPTATEPNADVVMELLDYSFNLSQPLGRGKQTIEVRNAGAHPHEVWLARLAPGKTVADLFASLAPDAPPDAWDTSGIGGITEILPGDHAYFTVDLDAGRYAIICFVFDHGAGNVHAGLGMVQEFTVE
jgi:hypothetical protein